ncbi:hypothetical protein CAPTEDRAFT_217991 [Capitella teleta]|uniref:Uncharacterized protein n=1 Tax=Capitella teleta TaxID=283909 RepID=R7TFV5_CAPTE|nr:hypothetical protein CAPTEDRAFT_217991 [Capitella teleta]|eukprot:ELT89926.1 hypothetical protein CAPTEDRAFT_217991 [Capitella teleta]
MKRVWMPLGQIVETELKHCELSGQQDVKPSDRKSSNSRVSLRDWRHKLLEKFRYLSSLVLLTLVTVLGLTFSSPGLLFGQNRRYLQSPDVLEPLNTENNDVESSIPKLPDFVRPDGKCEVPLAANRSSLPPCSHALFRSYYSKMRSYPECGTWVETEGYGFSQRYILDFCDFKPYNLPECSVRKGLHHILLLGDSTGWRTFMGLVNTTIWGGSNCHLVKSEGEKSMYPSSEYFSLGRKDLAETFWTKRRGCGWCRAAVYDCEMRTHSGSHMLRLEYVPAYRFRDRSMFVMAEKSQSWPYSRSFQEYILNTYLPLTNMPDVILIAFPLNHEKKYFRGVTDLAGLLDLVLKHVPRTTEVHWIPTASEFASRRPASAAMYDNLTYGEDKLDANSQIYLLTTQITRVLEPYLRNPKYNMYGFVSLFNMSSTKEEWNEDAIHFNYVWYAHVIRTLLSMLCFE